MKFKWIAFPLGMAIMMLFSGNISAQEINTADSTGLDGDNFSLQGAMELFKQAESPEAFEKMLNAPDNNVNNLDLDKDGQTDYVRVVDRMDGDAHAIVMQVPVSETESQDIAVIEVEKSGTDNAVLQIVGDEDIYGREIISEPYEEQVSRNNAPATRVVVNVWAWPAVRYVYRPAYVVYASPWRWRAYPTWWRPYRPHPWRVFYVRARPYHAHYQVVTTHRVVRAHAVYRPHRTHSTVVHTRTVTHVSKNGKRGSGPNHIKAAKTTKTTTVRGRRGGTVTKKESTTKMKGGAKRGRQH